LAYQPVIAHRSATRLESKKETKKLETNMHVYTVAKQTGTKDTEFEAYARLLTEQGVDISNIPRTEELGTQNRWLYVWNDKADAERFRDEIVKRTRQRDWYVREFDIDAVTHGPLEPLTIYFGREGDGFTYKLHPNSMQLIKKKFTGVNTVDSIFVGIDTRQDLSTQFETSWWDQLVAILTGVSIEKIIDVGGYQVYDPISKKVVVQHLP
jgi:hypothetical protein